MTDQITAEQAQELREKVGCIQTPMMDGDNLAILLCTHFDDGEENPDSDNGWSEKAEDGYEEVIGAIRAHYDPAIRTVIAQSAEIARLRADLGKAVGALKSVLDACDKGRMVANGGVGGMTIEANIQASVYNRVPAWPIEEARATLSEINHD